MVYLNSLSAMDCRLGSAYCLRIIFAYHVQGISSTCTRLSISTYGTTCTHAHTNLAVIKFLYPMKAHAHTHLLYYMHTQKQTWKHFWKQISSCTVTISRFYPRWGPPPHCPGSKAGMRTLEPGDLNLTCQTSTHLLGQV